MSIDSQYIVYCLIDPNTNDFGYIGKSMSGLKRAKEHFKSSSLKNDGNTRKANWIRKLQKSNQKPTISILFNIGNCSWSKEEINTCLYKKEQELIEYYNIIGYNLTNHQDGGPGSPNRKISEETRQKMSKSAKRRDLPQSLLEQQKPKNLPKKLRIRPSRVILGAREAHANSRRFDLLVYSVSNEQIIQFKGLNQAAKAIGGKCNKTGIRLAIKNKQPYYGYIWSKI